MAAAVAEGWQRGVRRREGSEVPAGCKVFDCEPAVLPEVCAWLFTDADYAFASLVVEETASRWRLRYFLHGRNEPGWVQLVTGAPLEQREFPTVSNRVHAADWQEREAEDLFGVVFAGHPRLGDFVLHDDVWQEGVEPMRQRFDGKLAMLRPPTSRGLAPATPGRGRRGLRVARGPGLCRTRGVGAVPPRDRR